ncbi:GNAT family N-acetyltransferase [uncultured Propionibacterium sp.]|uniref:GNAT family N-acetyltransferase n=1 Tax=uncultured Propionibacterium sp. TaxID=218066 RepID=UPI00292F5A1D|nr:GNAT family N-acetyltransferase [uncultured Propionibacterium sp.]
MKYPPGRVPAQVRRQLHRIIEASDRDFFPPLSWRTGTGETQWATRPQGEDVEPYFTSLMRQTTIITVQRDSTIAGFCAYQYPYRWRERTYLYISTAIVLPAFRGRRITSHFLAPIALAAMRHRSPILAKTWSSNHRSVGALRRWARQIEHIADDRAPGVDTLYWQFDPWIALRTLVPDRWPGPSQRTAPE